MVLSLMVVALLFLTGLVLILGIYVTVVYNSLVHDKVETDRTWSQIDVQLKRRHDLIPNLVETVKGVMDFEKGTLTQVVQARSSALAATDINERIKAENQITAGLGRITALWENYPALKSNENAQHLQQELVSTENRLSDVRDSYNDTVGHYNTLIQEVPSNLVAGMVGFKQRDFLKAGDDEKSAPKVQL
jgi:LemA protein